MAIAKNNGNYDDSMLIEKSIQLAKEDKKWTRWLIINSIALVLVSIVLGDMIIENDLDMQYFRELFPRVNSALMEKLMSALR